MLLRRYAAEYADDYDDQWDDAPSAMPFARKQQAVVVEGDTEAEGVFGQGGACKGKGRGNKGRKAERLQQQQAQWAQWDQEREDILRVNALIKEKEEERAFWADMSLARSQSNQHRGVMKEKDEGEEENGDRKGGEGGKPSTSISYELPSQPKGSATLPHGGKRVGEPGAQHG